MSTKDTIHKEISSAPRTVASLVEQLGVSESTARKALKELVEDGLATRDAATRTFAGVEATERKPRANHGYARNTSSARKADERDGELLDFLQEAGEAQVLKDIAEGLGITVRAARHAVWRNVRAGLVERVERKFYQLVEDAA